MKKSGDASSSMNGYNYQRLYMIVLILQSLNNETIKSIKEEHYEDCDLIKTDGNLILNQIKYHDEKSLKISENIDVNSGLYKVITRSETLNNINNIDEINYISNAKYQKELFNFFETKQYVVLSKYLQIKIFNKINSSCNNFDVKISDTDKINLIYKENTCIYNYFKDRSDSILNRILINENEYTNYFNKIKLKKGESYEELNKEINELIKSNYTINNNSDIFLIKYKIYDYLMDKMFKKYKTPINILTFKNINENKTDINFGKILEHNFAKVTNDNNKFLNLLLNDIILLDRIQNNDNNLKYIINIINNFAKQSYSIENENYVRSYLCNRLLKKINNFNFKYDEGKRVIGKINHIYRKKHINKHNTNYISKNIIKLINNHNKKNNN